MNTILTPYHFPHFFLDNMGCFTKTKIDFTLNLTSESNHWHEQPAIVKSNLKSILVSVKHFPVGFVGRLSTL